MVSYQALFRLSVYKIPAVYLSGAKKCVFARYATLFPRLLAASHKWNYCRSAVWLQIEHFACSAKFYILSPTAMANRMAIFAASIAAGDNIKYQSLVLGSFVWGIHLKYNNGKYHPSKCDYHILQDNMFDNHHLRKCSIY